MPNVGDNRMITFFTFIPRRIGNQSRWLEMVTIDQKYGCGSEPTCTEYGWQDLRFVVQENTDGYERQ